MNQVVYNEPFSIGSPRQVDVPHGLTIDQIGVHIGMSTTERKHSIVRIGDAVIPRIAWSHVRPKPGVDVVFQRHLQGGGDEGGGKGASILATVASIGLAVFSAGVAGGSAARLLGARFAAGTVGAYALAGATSIAGSFLLQALLPSPTLGRGPQSLDRARGAASAQGNVLEPNGPIPRVIGSRKIYPPFATQPRYEYVGQDEFVEALFALAGPHDLSDVQIDGTLIESAEDVEFEIREGWDNDIPITLISKQAIVADDRVELSVHKADPDDQGQPETLSSVPIWHGLSTGSLPDRINVQLTLPQGLNIGASTTSRIRVPFLMRIKGENDSDWIDLPEFHYVDALVTNVRLTIRIEFYDDVEPQFGSPIPTSVGFVEARNENADAYFSAGSGDPYLNAANEGSSDLDKIELGDDTIVFKLDRATFSDSKYAIEIKRGAALLNSQYNAAAHTYRGESIPTQVDLFGLTDDQELPESRENMADSIFVARTVSEWDEHPVAGRGLALIAIRAKNRVIENVSTLASGYVRDWSGSAWDDWVTTSNPAPHYRDVLTGQLNFDPVPVSIVDDTNLLAWRTRCATEGFTCDHISEGDTVEDLLRVIAGCGYAKPYQSEVWGVIYDYDRSADAPMQLFTRRNSRNFRMRKALGRIPDGLRINFPKNVGNSTNDQIIVPRPSGSGGVRYDQVTYDGMIDPGRVADRGLYDIRQIEYRSTTYMLEAPADAVRCRRGDLVAVENDILMTSFASARVLSVVTVGTTITGITLDAEVDLLAEDDILAQADLLSVDDLLLLGATTGAAVRDSTGDVHILTISNATGSTDTLTVSGSPDIGDVPIATGDLVTIGLVGQEYLRMLVSEVEPRDDLIFELTLIDEAPEVWANG